MPVKEISRTLPADYEVVLESISSKISIAQRDALSVVNRQLINLYRDIGETIHAHQASGQ